MDTLSNNNTQKPQPVGIVKLESERIILEIDQQAINAIQNNQRNAMGETVGTLVYIPNTTEKQDSEGKNKSSIEDIEKDSKFPGLCEMIENLWKVVIIRNPELHTRNPNIVPINSLKKLSLVILNLQQFDEQNNPELYNIVKSLENIKKERWSKIFTLLEDNNIKNFIASPVCFQVGKDEKSSHVEFQNNIKIISGLNDIDPETMEIVELLKQDDKLNFKGKNEILMALFPKFRPTEYEETENQEIQTYIEEYKKKIQAKNAKKNPKKLADPQKIFNNNLKAILEEIKQDTTVVQQRLDIGLPRGVTLFSGLCLQVFGLWMKEDQIKLKKYLMSDSFNIKEIWRKVDVIKQDSDYYDDKQYGNRFNQHATTLPKKPLNKSTPPNSEGKNRLSLTEQLKPKNFEKSPIRRLVNMIPKWLGGEKLQNMTEFRPTEQQRNRVRLFSWMISSKSDLLNLMAGENMCTNL